MHRKTKRTSRHTIKRFSSSKHSAKHSAKKQAKRHTKKHTKKRPYSKKQAKRQLGGTFVPKDDQNRFYPETKAQLVEAVHQWMTHLDTLEEQEPIQERYGYISDWNVSRMTDLSELFSPYPDFAFDVGTWDVSQATNLSGMFRDCATFDENLNGWNVSRVSDFSRMFAGCEAFQSPLENWDVSSAVNFSEMFLGCISFNTPLGRWNVSRAETTEEMFAGCESFEQSLQHWDLSRCRNTRNMFEGCPIALPHRPPATVGDQYLSEPEENEDSNDEDPKDHEVEKEPFVSDAECEEAVDAGGEPIEDPVTLETIPPGFGFKLEADSKCYNKETIRQLRTPVSPLTRAPFTPRDLSRKRQL